MLRNWASVVDDPVAPGPPELQLAPNREKGIAAAAPRRLALARARVWATKMVNGANVVDDPVAPGPPELQLSGNGNDQNPASDL